MKKKTRKPRAEKPEARQEVARKPARVTKPTSVLSPRDERGTPYPGDFPNPLRGKIRDCF